MKLDTLLVADPNESTAQLIADQCERLAEKRVVVTTAPEALQRAHELTPNVVVFALEMPRTSARAFVPDLLKAAPSTLLVATYRELSVTDMRRLAGLGVAEFVAQPIDIIQIYRAASHHFNVPFRRHDRYSLSLEVFRADGVLIGKTCDISEGGMCLTAYHPIAAGESLLVDLELPAGEKALRIRCLVLGIEGQAPATVRARVQFTKLFGREQRRLLDFLQSQPAAIINE
jgi:CheY-like chemotaxis protein